MCLDTPVLLNRPPGLVKLIHYLRTGLCHGAWSHYEIRCMLENLAGIVMSIRKVEKKKKIQVTLCMDTAVPAM